MAAGAEGDQGLVGLARAAVMDDEEFCAPADAASLAVAGEDTLSQTPEAGARERARR